MPIANPDPVILVTCSDPYIYKTRTRIRFYRRFRFRSGLNSQIEDRLRDNSPPGSLTLLSRWYRNPLIFFNSFIFFRLSKCYCSRSRRGTIVWTPLFVPIIFSPVKNLLPCTRQLVFQRFLCNQPFGWRPTQGSRLFQLVVFRIQIRSDSDPVGFRSGRI